ncbi:39S ribosomal protein L21, mitochondrial [Trichogramma pretiosum]|uniref:39S ribosomal protein L21, mitochondrial n=1 Tax=Trichogramma pretiosum TaxID=7493 RepID=UPI0006C94744|nr:39S ribosomal protein L21, mitochondrial [Trichogramma pretiosum]
MACSNFSRLLQLGARACTSTIASNTIVRQSPLVPKLWDLNVRYYRKMKGVPRHLPWFPPKPPATPDYQSEVVDPSEENEKLITEVSKEINKQIAEDKTGRLFAIVHVAGKQFKVTESDIIIIRGYWPPNIGDQIKLEKVLLLGSKDFTLVGRPILNRELVSIDATVIEKTLSNTITHFRFRKRKQYRRIHFYKYQHTYVRINSITLNGEVDKKLEVEGLDRVY